MTDKKQTEVDVNVGVAELLQKASTGSMGSDALSAIATMLLAREARVAVKEQALETQIKARDEERKKESERFTIALIESQKACKHLKGGPGRSRGQQRDPAVYQHTFTDGKTQIKCTLCKAKWMPKDTEDYLDRNGSKIPNWTGIGWRQACELAMDSTNRPSTSERFFVGSTEQEISEAAREVAKTPNLQL